MQMFILIIAAKNLQRQPHHHKLKRKQHKV